MATGDTQDVFKRLYRALPAQWFPDVTLDPNAAPVLSSILYAMAYPLSLCFQLIQAVGNATRLRTSSGVMLDMASQDFFGPDGLPRLNGEGDEAYIERIQRTIVAQKNTRDAVSGAIQGAGANNAQIIESGNAADCGFYAVSGLAHGGYGQQTLRYSGSCGEFYVDSPSGATVAQISNAVVNTKVEGVRAWIRTTPPS